MEDDTLQMLVDGRTGEHLEIFTRGDTELLGRDKTRVSIVGSREASHAGLMRAYDIAAKLARVGIVVVSGLARGVDKKAHLGAIDGGGRTIAVLGTPLDNVYPAEHKELQMQIGREHLLVSEFPRWHPTTGQSFIARNRTMAVIAHAAIVVESTLTSGTMSHARAAKKLRRPVFIPDGVRETDWGKKLMAAGALPFETVDHILRGLRLVHPGCRL